MSVADEDNFLSRWSRRKSQARGQPPAEPAPQAPAQSAAQPPAAVPGQEAPPPEARPAPAALPPLESLTPQSDFTPFMAPEVDAQTRSTALKALFADPHFNAMDMMDVYVDDYSKPDPLPASWLEKLEQLSHLGDKAGRDREAAERARALEEARAKGEAGPAAAPEEAPAEAVAAKAADPAPDTPIPPPAIGESGA